MPDIAKLRNLAGQLKERQNARVGDGRRAWYNIRNAADVAEVYIYDMIGEGGVTAADMIGELKAIGARQIHVHLSSEGGEVFDGLAIYEALKQHPAKVRTMVDSLAASAASFIAMAADPYDAQADMGGVFMAKRARMMIHDAACGGGQVYGNAAAMRQFVQDITSVADILDDMSNNIADIYAERAGGDRETWRASMSKETWYSADQALSARLIDGIIGETTSATPAEEMMDAVELDFQALAAALKGAWE